MIEPGRRLAAFGVDGALALVLTGIVISPILAFAPPDFWARTNPIPLIWALILIGIGLLNRGRTPGKRWLGLRVAGTGCIVCREIRRVYWALIYGMALLIAQHLEPWLVQSFCGVLLLADMVPPLLRRAPEFPHNAKTGFWVERAGAPSL